MSKTIIGLLVGVGALWLPAPSAAAAQEVSAAYGAEVYARTCGRCHNPRSPLERSDREWTVITAHMRVRGNLTGREMRAVRLFLQAVNREEPGGQAAPPDEAVQLLPEVDSALAARGRVLAERSNCAACHTMGAATMGTLGPGLNDLLRRRTADYVLRKLANPRFDDENTMMPRLSLTAEERRAILEYLRTLQAR